MVSPIFIASSVAIGIHSKQFNRLKEVRIYIYIVGGDRRCP